jgi:hypothetical protein
VLEEGEAAVAVVVDSGRPQLVVDGGDAAEDVAA